MIFRERRQHSPLLIRTGGEFFLMKRFLTLSLALTAVATFGLVSLAKADTPVQVSFHAENGSGITGSATLVQSGDDVVVVTSTKGGGDLEPVHVHKGSCSSLGAV